MSKPILLVADDVEMNRNVIKRFLQQDFDVLEASDGVQVLDTLKQTHVDMLLLDIIMPELDGLQVLQEIRKVRAFDGLGILVATSTKEKTERSALSLGADDIVAKPYDPIVIRRRIANILAKKRLEAYLGSAEVACMPKQETQRDELLHHADHIDQRLRLIDANLSNHKLVLELSDSIRKELQAMRETL